MADDLDAPATSDEIYLARGDEVPLQRPLLTGDVFEGVALPGVSEEPTRVVIITHPCSMRLDGVDLEDRLHVARVDEAARIPWRSTKRSLMPLPDLTPGSFHVARFDLMTMVPSEALLSAPRVACMSVRGVNLLQQRLIWFLTRLAVPTAHLNDVGAPVFEEVDLQEEWVDVAMSAGVPVADAERDFHTWLRDVDASGVRRQDRLKEPESRASVRRALGAELRDRF